MTLSLLLMAKPEIIERIEQLLKPAIQEEDLDKELGSLIRVHVISGYREKR